MSFSTRAMAPADWAALKHFKATEFAYPARMGFEFVMWLEKVRELAGVPMDPSSSYRTPEHNRQVGGAADSAHTDTPFCDAVDIRMVPRSDDPNWNYSRWQIFTAARDLGCVRVGLYSNGSLHLDRTEGKRPAPRLWVVVAGHPSP